MSVTGSIARVSSLDNMIKPPRKLRRAFRPIRLVIFVLIFGCLLHVHQIYLGSKTALEKSRQRKRMLFLSQERKQLKKEKVQETFPKYSLEQPSERVARNESCNHKKSILFLKTHKTGSTTVTNIILRHAVKYRLSVGLPPPRHWQLGGYPATFDSKIVAPQLQKYDVLCHHIRYDDRLVRRVLAADSTFITILRDPADGFESGFAFFRDWPYSEWFRNLSQPENLQLFLDNPHAYYNISTPWYFRAKNYMAFDLGFDQDRNDLKYTDMAIRSMDEWFDLVLITDRMDESLILLKDLMCMDSFDDIVYLRLKVRQKSARRDVTSKMRDQMRAWNLLDSKLYKHFNNTLDRKIDAYGRKRMDEELKKFRNILVETEKKCVLYYDQYHMKPWVSRIKLRENSGEFCETISWGEVKFGDFMRSFQQPYVDTEKMHQPSFEEINLLLRNAQKSVIGGEAVHNSA